MCGIAGIVNFSQEPVAQNDLLAMSQAMSYRGPDGHGTFLAGHIGIAHRRLAIIDPRAGIQPFRSENDALALTYNGEVYNYIELRDELKCDQTFRTTSDTEVVLRAYQKWGIESVTRLQGMFAYGLFDRLKQKLYLVRDRLGIKPLYYYQARDRFAFSSELFSLLALPWLERRIDPQGLQGFLQFQYVPTPRTIYHDVHKLEPGCYLEVDVTTGIARKQRYWSLEIQEKEQSEEDWLAELEGEFDQVVRRYIRSDVPCGSFLSGGVDSSLVTAMMVRHTPTPPMSFSCGFREGEYSELPFAAQVARIVGTDHHESFAMVESTISLVRSLVSHFGEPFGDSSAVPTFLVSKAAAQHVKVVLSGDGGDELFAGYQCYAMLYRQLRQPTLPERAKHIIARVLTSLPMPGRIYNWATRRIIEPNNRYREARRIFANSDLPPILQRDLFRTFSLGSEQELHPYMERGIDAITSCQARDTHTYMLDDILTKVDRMSMANSLEVRVPFLDHKIVALAFSLPLNMKLRAGTTGGSTTTKYLLKKLAAKFFPDALIHRPKMGFGIPVEEWCRTEMREMIEDHLRDPRSAIFDFLSFKGVQKVLDIFYRRNASIAAQIWCLMMLDLWFREVHAIPCNRVSSLSCMRISA